MTVVMGKLRGRENSPRKNSSGRDYESSRTNSEGRAGADNPHDLRQMRVHLADISMYAQTATGALQMSETNNLICTDRGLGQGLLKKKWLNRLLPKPELQSNAVAGSWTAGRKTQKRSRAQMVSCLRQYL